MQLTITLNTLRKAIYVNLIYKKINFNVKKKALVL